MEAIGVTLGFRTSLAPLLALGIAGCDPTPIADVPTSQTAALEVTRGPIEATVLLTGELQAAESIGLSVPRTDAWNLSIRWLAEDGTPVTAGDRMVEFDNTAVLDKIGDHELAVIQAGNDLASHQATAAVDREEKKFEVDKHAVELEKAELDSKTPEDLLSRYEHRQFQLAAQRAQVALSASKEDLEAALSGGKLEEQIKRIAYDKASRKLEGATEQVDALVSTAPRDGLTVINNHPWEGRKFQVGDTVWPGFTVAGLPDLSKMVVEASLSDVDDGRIHVGMKTRCIIDAFPDRPLPGVVKAISPVAREPERQSARRFFSVVVELDETNTEIMRPGLSVKVEVTVGRADDVLLAPRAGLDRSGETPRAFLADGDEVEVELGLCSPQACEVVSGLSEGTQLRPVDHEETHG